MVSFHLVIWLQLTFLDQLPKSLIFQDWRVWDSTGCIFNNVHNVIRIFPLLVSGAWPRFSQRANTSTWIIVHFFTFWLVTGGELSLLSIWCRFFTTGSLDSPALIKRCPVVAAPWRGHTWGSLGFHAQLLSGLLLYSSNKTHTWTDHHSFVFCLQVAPSDPDFPLF